MLYSFSEMPPRKAAKKADAEPADSPAAVSENNDVSAPKKKKTQQTEEPPVAKEVRLPRAAKNKKPEPEPAPKAAPKPKAAAKKTEAAEKKTATKKAAKKPEAEVEDNDEEPPAKKGRGKAVKKADSEEKSDEG